MSKFSDITTSGTYMLAYINSNNVLDNSIYATYDYIDSTIFTLGIQGCSVAGVKDNAVPNRANFYVFGGRDGSDVFSNDMIKVVIELFGGGPVLISEQTLSCTNKPPKRMYANMVSIQSYIYIAGGVDELGNLLYDIQRFSISNNSWTEITPTGTIPSPRFLSGNM